MNLSTDFHSIFLKFILVITFPSTFRSSKHSLFVRFHAQILLSYECYIFHPQHLPCLHCRKNIWQDLLVGKLFICLLFSKNFYNSVLIKSLNQNFSLFTDRRKYIPVISGEEHKLRRSTLCKFLAPLTSSRLASVPSLHARYHF